MKAIVIGSGLSGLTAAAYLCRSGHKVIVYEQFPDIGGVTATVREDGFGWDLGPMLIDGFLPGEKVNRILNELEIASRVKIKRSYRGISFPDFSLWKPSLYKGPFWRRDYLKELFPEDSRGLDNYYKLYKQMEDLSRYSNALDSLTGLKAMVIKAKRLKAFLSVKGKMTWTAEQLMEHYFKRQELRALYTGILADFVVKPSQFPALGVPLSNIETAFDDRIPLDKKDGASLTGYSYILGGCGSLVDALAGAVREKDGQIIPGRAVDRIRINEGRATGVVLSDGHFEPADIVIAGCGVRETFFDLIGEDLLPAETISHINKLKFMQSVFMVHLGVNFDPLQYQKAALCYYYGSYDIEGGVDNCQKGHYHEGKDGFLVYIPSVHSPELALPNHHAVTIYTIAPNSPDEGTWSGNKESLADKLVSEAEKYVPGLREGTVCRKIITPEDFRKRIRQKHHSFGGLPPVINQKGLSFKTPIEGLWFIGSQSESGGGIQNVMTGARTAVRNILSL